MFKQLGFIKRSADAKFKVLDKPVENKKVDEPAAKLGDPKNPKAPLGDKPLPEAPAKKKETLSYDA
jgi:hypothetical protein